ncbi:hypothetical protein EKO04_006634 [Ascochyta lentis]|uniref:Uncharacterized protein n=1 Tax=Ascochyta lentis TaxID=205686 RepID=A0A8H7J2P8_9PLEO|nr:hypothetical protein EKO04_006634 [Ascochyta lentis]
MDLTDQLNVEAIRAELRQREATRRDKESEFRKCYIAQKITSVPCDEEGNILDGYSPLDNSHPFDTATPRTGPNMFDGIEVERPQTKDPKRKKTSKKVAPMMVSSRKGEPEDGSSSASEAASENLEDPLAEGARWLNEQKELARRRQEEGTSPIRRRRATARPTVLSSSPETDMSSFVVHSSSPLVTQMSPHDQVHSPRSSKKRKREPDNTTRTTEHRQFVRLTRANQKAPNSLRANKNTKIGATVVPSAQKGHHKAAGKLTAPQPVAKAPKGLLSKRVYSAL